MNSINIIRSLTNAEISVLKRVTPSGYVYAKPEIIKSLKDKKLVGQYNYVRLLGHEVITLLRGVVPIKRQLNRSVPDDREYEATQYSRFVALLRRHDDRSIFKVVEVPEGQSLDFDEDRATRVWLHPYLGSDWHLSAFYGIGPYDDPYNFITSMYADNERLRAALK